MQKTLLIAFICLFAACEETGVGTVHDTVGIINKIGTEYGLTYKDSVLKDGTKWYQAHLLTIKADSIEKKIKSSIFKELNLMPVKTVENEFVKSDKYAYLLDTYEWQTPKMKLEMKYTQDMTKSVDPKYYITFQVSKK